MDTGAVQFKIKPLFYFLLDHLKYKNSVAKLDTMKGMSNFGSMAPLHMTHTQQSV